MSVCANRAVVALALSALLPALSLAAAPVGDIAVSPALDGEAEREAVSESDDGAVGSTTAMFASAAYPGLGQLLNGAEPKAAIVSAAEALLVSALVVEDRRTRNALRMYDQTGDDDWYVRYSDHYDRRQTLVWWVAVAALYGLADAYVDANLTGFDETSSPGFEGSLDTGSGGELRLGVSMKF
jgi:hypothetical protein